MPLLPAVDFFASFMGHFDYSRLLTFFGPFFQGAARARGMKQKSPFRQVKKLFTLK